MDTDYEVLNPWADADLMPLKGLVTRIADLENKKIGLFTLSYKHASELVNKVIEERLKQRFPSAQFSYYYRNRGEDFENVGDNTGNLSRKEDEAARVMIEFENWLDGLDAVVAAVGD